MRQTMLMIAGAAAIAAAAVLTTLQLQGAAPTPSFSGADLRATIDEAGDYRIHGSDVAVSGRVGGHLFVRSAQLDADDLTFGSLEAHAKDVRLAGVEGDAIVHAVSFSLDGDVDGRLQVSTMDLAMDGRIAGPLEVNMIDGHLSGEFADTRIRGSDVELRNDARFHEDVEVSARDVRMDGHVDGQLTASVRSLHLGGTVTGPTSINAHPGVVRDETRDGLVWISGQLSDVDVCARRLVVRGAIHGTLHVSTDQPPIFEDGGAAARVVYSPRVDGRCTRIPTPERT